MYADALDLLFTDLEVTLLRGILVIVGIFAHSNHRFTTRLAEGKELIAAWEIERLKLLAPARRAMRRMGLTIFGICVITLFILQTFFLSWVKSLHTPTNPILGTEMAWQILGIGMAGLILAAFNLDREK